MESYNYAEILLKMTPADRVKYLKYVELMEEAGNGKNGNIDFSDSEVAIVLSFTDEEDGVKYNHRWTLLSALDCGIHKHEVALEKERFVHYEER